MQPEKSCFDHPSFGPCFGSSDIYIWDKSNQKLKNFTDPGKSYEGKKIKLKLKKKHKIIKNKNKK